MSDDAAVAWLRKQIEGDKTLAGKAGGKAWHVASWLPGDARRVEGDDITIYDEGGHDEDQAAHIALHDPQDVVADCEAKLALLGEHYILFRGDQNEAYAEFSVVRIGGADQDHGCVTCHYYGQGGVKGYGYCRTVRALASAYRHRPGYADHWGD